MREYMPDPEDFDEGIHIYAEFSAAARLIWAPRYNLALERRLKRLLCPSLVVRAEDDRLVPNEMAEKFAEMIPGTGHEVCLERPEELTEVLLRFVKEAM